MNLAPEVQDFTLHGESRPRMSPTPAGPAPDLLPARAAELAALVELEARWENLRTAPSRTAEARSTTQDLHTMQKAYEAFRTKLAAFCKHYPPGHVPELLLNTPIRLGLWCRQMRELFRQVADTPQGRYPGQLMEKAYRTADKLAGRWGVPSPPRPAPADDVGAAIRELDALEKWCHDLARPVAGAA